MQKKLIHIAIMALVLGLSLPIHAQEGSSDSNFLEQPSDSLQKQEVIFPDLPDKSDLEVEQDSTKVDSIVAKEPLLQDKVLYKAKDYTKINQKQKKLYLYNEAELYYQDFTLKAGIIIFDYENHEVYAKGIIDSVGNYNQRPIFSQGGNLFETDSIRSNTQTKKALIWNTWTEQSNGVLLNSEVVKKVNDTTYYQYHTRVTTSTNKEDPEYYILIRKAKVVPDRKIVAGLSNMYIANVPTPIGVPFAYFPLTNSRSSGVIIPVFGDDSGNRGFFFQNGGYYFAVSDYADLTVVGDYYTNGSYAMNLESNYNLRYKFGGNMGLRFENLVSGQRGFPGYNRSSIYNIRWNHRQDPKTNPNSRLSASVNFGSSQYYQQSINQFNVANQLNNTLNSSVSYSLTFPSYPAVNMSLTTSISQNTRTEQINMTLPTFQGSLERIFPFASQDQPKKGALQNINFQYNLRAENRIQTNDDEFFTSEMWDDARNGVQHSVPISTNFKLFNYLSMSMGGQLEETWGFKTIQYSDYEDENNPSIKDTLSGFDRYLEYNFNTSLGTTLYGVFNRGEDKKLQAIRHVMRPSISFGYNPGFDQYYESYQATANPDDLRFYSRFDEFLFGAPSRGKSSSIGLSLNNTLEAKVRSKDSTSIEPRKVTLLNNLNFSTSYNLVADSLAWSPLRMTGNTSFFSNKMSVNFGATMDPYALDNNGRRVDQWNINNGGSLFRLTNASLNIGYSFSSKNFKRREETDQEKFERERSGGREDDLFGVSENFADRTQTTRNETDEEQSIGLYSAAIPWDLRFQYAVNYNNPSGQNEIGSHSLMFSGNMELTPNWSVGVSSGYDFKNEGFTLTQIRIQRDLDSWQFNFSWTPIGLNQAWYFFIGIKSSIFSDIKYDKRRQPDRRL